MVRGGSFVRSNVWVVISTSWVCHGAGVPDLAGVEDLQCNPFITDACILTDTPTDTAPIFPARGRRGDAGYARRSASP